MPQQCPSKGTLMLSFSAGPFALSVDRLILLIALGVALIVGWLWGRRHKVSVEPAITAMVLWGVLGARLGFVLLYRAEYLQNPLDIFDIRDGGFLVEAGVAVAAIVALYHGWRHSVVRLPLTGAVASGAVSWMMMAGAISLMEMSRPVLPNQTLASLEGQQVSLPSLGGKPLVINLWATWCPPCLREMPVLAEAQAQITDVEFIFVNQGETVADVTRYLEKSELQLRNVLLDPTMDVARQLGSQAMPTTLFYTADGRLAGSHLGELSRATLQSNLDLLASHTKSNP